MLLDDSLRLEHLIPGGGAGVAYPDLMILDPDFLTKGARGVRAWGYFGNDWSVETGKFAWRDATL